MKKLVKKTKSASVKFTELEFKKLETLANNKDMKNATLIRELVKIGFKQVMKREL